MKAAVFAVMLLALSALTARAQTAENVAVVINTASAASQQIGEYYIKQRAIPASNVIRIRTSQDETIARQAYAATIEGPIAAVLSRERLHDRILYIVLTKGIPLRIAGTAGLDGTVSSVDSELTLLYRRMTGQNVAVRGRIPNPYYLGTRNITEARPFTHRDHDIFLVTRLDAFTVKEALALVDKASTPSTEGHIVLDQRNLLSDAVRKTGDQWLATAAERLKTMGHGERVVLDTGTSGARDITPVIGYYSWGSNDPRNRVRRVNMGFVNGAIAATFVSSDARTFREPPADWVPPGDNPDKSSWFGGSPQTLIGDVIREGATGVAGHVAEPYIQSTSRPEILFPAYLSGFNLVESFYLAIPHLSWQTVVIGDPLLAPFARRRLQPADIDTGLDPETQLPAFFAKRRLAAAAPPGSSLSPRAAALSVRAENQLVRGDAEGAQVSLEEATELAPNVASLHLRLALLQESNGKHELAMERYRRVLALQPNNSTALNNLAYALATRSESPKEALPLARRAVAAAPRDGTIVDTLAWVEYLVGDHATAARRIAEAIKLAPNVAEIRLHAAVINAAGGARAVAETQLKEALRLDPSMEKREEVRQVRAALEKLGAK